MSKGAFKNFKFKNLSFKNKVVMAPESSNSSNQYGMATEFHFNHYASKALNGVGTVIVEATAVEKRGRKSAKDLGIWSDKHIKGFRKISKAIKDKEAVAGIQLFHSGKKGQAFATNNENKEIEIKEFTEKDVNNIIKSFKKAAKRALKAGFDFIEINGDFISEFLSSDLNKRDDKYGGSFENRSRAVLEVVKAIREVWSDEKLLAIRLSSELYTDDKKDRAEITELIEKLKLYGVDLINISTENEREIEKATLNKIKSKEEAFEKSLPIVEGGLINIAEKTDEILNRNSSIAFLGQAILRDSYWIINGVKSFVSQKTYAKLI